MPRLTLRTLLAYIDDTLNAAEARELGQQVAESEEARLLVERIKKVTRRRGLATPVASDPDDETADPNTVAAYLDNTLEPERVKELEETCLKSDVHLAEVAACHQILTLLLTEPVRVPPRAHKRMYQIVKPPVSIPDRLPNKKLPVVGLAPQDEGDEAETTDAAFLLGMKRYSSSTPWAERVVFVATIAVLLLVLTIGVVMSLPRAEPRPPFSTPGSSYAVLQPVAPPQLEPPPKDKEAPLPKEKEPTAVVTAPPPRAIEDEKPPVEPGPGLGPPILPASNDRSRPIAQVKSRRSLVVSQQPNSGVWQRIGLNLEAIDAVMPTDPVMALPGYKAELSVDRKLQLTLWGNVPEQIPYRILESRVTLHIPPEGFAADITLLAGRIYLKSEQAAGAKVRVRLASEVWDITLPDDKSSVLVELISWFQPGTPYNRQGGSQPKREGRVAVAFGSAQLETTGNRFVKFEKMAIGEQVTWDSVKNTLQGPTVIARDDYESLLEINPTNPVKGELLREVTRLLTFMADEVKTREAVGPVVKNFVGPQLPSNIPVLDRDLLSRLAIYAHAAMCDNTEEGSRGLRVLVDVLRSESPWLARQAVVTALVQWVARAVGNTALLYNVLLEKGLSEREADRLLMLLRAYIAPTQPDPDKLDELVNEGPNREPPLLGDPEVAIREAALWNIMVARLQSWVPLPLTVNVGAVGAKVGSEEYRRFLAESKKWIEEIKRRNVKMP
ncbi:MAG: hypothetical protein RMJ56_15270 [Gemmataceae bacterium]|nr:hypothetical protein [Gemmata sp.]MDW8198957.1 hypothetical protein [Gemmataceae bacterium]